MLTTTLVLTFLSGTKGFVVYNDESKKKAWLCLKATQKGHSLCIKAIILFMIWSQLQWCLHYECGDITCMDLEFRSLWITRV